MPVANLYAKDCIHTTVVHLWQPSLLHTSVLNPTWLAQFSLLLGSSDAQSGADIVVSSES